MRNRLCWVLSPFELNSDERAAIRAEERTAGLIAPSPLDADHEETGYFGRYDCAARRATWPAVSARTLVLIGPLAAMPTRMLVDAWRHGVRRIVRPSPDQVTSRSVRALVMRRVLQAGANRLGRTWIKLSMPTRALHWIEDDAGFAQLAERARVPLRCNAGHTSASRTEVMFVCDSLGAGGAERQMVLTIEQLLTLDRFGASVYTLGNPEGLFAARLRALGVEPRGVAMEARLGSRDWALADRRVLNLLDRLPAQLGVRICALAEEMRRSGPGVVHAWMDMPSVIAGLAAHLAGVPRVVLGGRNLAPDRLPSSYDAILRPAFRVLATMPTTRIVANSRAGARDYERWLDAGSGTVGVIWNALDPTIARHTSADDVARLRASLGIPASAPVVGGVFRFDAQKRPLLWIRVAAEIAARRPEVHFVIAGVGRMERTMRRAIQRRGLEGRTRLVPPTTAVAQVIASLDVFLLTSSVEGLPNVLMEAQAQGIAVVTTDAGGAREIVDSGRTGWIVDVNAPARAIATAVLGLLADSRARERARRAGPSFVAERFGVETMLEQTVAAYALDD